MTVHRRIRIPDAGKPALCRESDGVYALWSGRDWFGSVYRVRGGWCVTTPGSHQDVLGTFKGACIEAEARANRAEGRGV